MEDAGIHDLIQLIVRLEKTGPRSLGEAEQIRSAHSFNYRAHDSDSLKARARYEKHRPRAFDIVANGCANGKYLDQSMEWNVLFLNRLLDDWFANAHSLPPHWAVRICVLLRKAQRLDLEYEFLRAFMPHYQTPFINADNDVLIARAAKIGAKWA